jgi:dipeptidyl aminopeptidase/acylaminoacyl peptidase
MPTPLLPLAVSDETRRASCLLPDDLFALKYIRDARISPDGRFVAYAVSSTVEEIEHFEVFIAQVDGQSIRRLPFSGRAMSPRWSPDGRSLAFVGDGRLYLTALPTLRVHEPLTPAEFAVQGAPSWSPDGTRIAVSLMRDQVVKGRRVIARRIFRAEGIGFTDGITQTICVIDYANKSLRWMTGTPEGMSSQPEWSPCGRFILFFATSAGVPLSSYSPRLMTVTVQDGAVTPVLDDRWFVTAARWLPCGKRIAVSAARDSALTIPNASLWVVDLQGNAELRTPRLAGNIGGMIHHDMPAWDLMCGNPIAVCDQQWAYVTVLTRGALEIWRVALSGEIEAKPVLRGERSCVALDVNSTADIFLYAVTTLHSPTELWRAAIDGRNEKRLTALNDDVLSRWPSVNVEQFVFSDADGLEIDAWFMSPASGRRPFPTVLFIHGGPFAATGHAFRYDFNLLASNGFGVLFSNFRGSSGYGDSFTAAIMGKWGERGFPHHIGAVDAAITRGLADRERLGVWGASHGGFATCWIVGHTSRFKAAVAEAAVTNFVTVYYLTDGPDVFARDLGGRPHEIPDVYRACSPMTYAHRCTTPTMLLHGENDLRCPISEAEQFYRVLHDVGCATELVRVPDCNHLGDSCGSLQARRTQNEALLGWFQRYL